MTPRDQELLERQLRGLRIPPRRDGAMILVIVAIFLAGIFLGSLRSDTRDPVRFDTMAAALSAASGSNATQVR